LPGSVPGNASYQPFQAGNQVRLLLFAPQVVVAVMIAIGGGDIYCPEAYL